MPNIKEASAKKSFVKKVNKKRHPKWYFDKKVLRPSKNYKWSLEDRALLYEMRVSKDMSIASIQLFFRKRDGLPMDSDNDKYTYTRLHNQIRMARASMNGLCHKCRKKMTQRDLKRYRDNRKGRSPDLLLCTKCFEQTKEYKKEKELEAANKGLCIDCRKRRALPGRSTCKRCLSWTQRVRVINNLCSGCGEKPISKKSITFCDDCMETNRVKAKKYRVKCTS